MGRLRLCCLGLILASLALLLLLRDHGAPGIVTVVATLAFIAAVVARPSVISASSLFLPLAGLLLSLWARRTRDRRRVSGIAKYYTATSGGELI